MDGLALTRFRNKEEEYRTRSRETMERAESEVMKSTLTSDKRVYYGNLLKQELDAKNDLAMENASRSQSKVEAESSKKKKERRKDYEKKMLKYGGSVTMETAAMQRNLKRFQKSWAKEIKEPNIIGLVDNLDLSGEMFDIMMIKGSKQHIDIKKIMRTLSTLRVINQNIDQIKRNQDELLTPAQILKLEIGMEVLPNLEAAVASLLQSHALDENGNVVVKRKEHEKTSENTGLSEIISQKQMMEHSLDVEEAVVQYKTALGDAFARVSDRQELKFSEEEDRQLTEHELTEDGLYQERVKRARRLDAIARKRLQDTSPGRRLDENGRQGIERLTRECLDCYVALDRLTANTNAKRKQLDILKAMKNPTDDALLFMEKLQLSILADRSRPAYQEAFHQSKRLERMLLGVCEGKPLTVAMRMELAEEYHLTSYGIEPFQQAHHQNEADAPVLEANTDEMKERGRLEKRADRFQNYLGARSLDSLSESERRENQELIDYIERYDNHRKAKIGELEEWLRDAEHNQEMSELKDSLKLEEETIKDTSLVEGFNTVMGWAGRINQYVTHLGVGGAITNIVQGESYKNTLTGKLFSYFGDATNSIKQLVILLKDNDKFANWSKLSNTERITLIMTKGKALADATNQALKSFAKLSKAQSGIAGNLLGGIGSLFDITSQAASKEAADNRRVNTDVQMKIFKRKLLDIGLNSDAHSQQEKKDLNRFQRMLGAANRNAEIDYVESSIKTATAVAKSANSFILKPVSAPISTIVSSALILTERVSERISASQKATLRKEYVTKNLGTFLTTLRRDERFKTLSDRDIKHTFLRFLGIKSGKRSEAGIRNMAVDSSYLVRDTEEGNTAPDRYESEKENKRSVLRAMGIATEKATRKDVMKAMGASANQAANPLLASNKIYRNQLSRNKDYKEGRLGRWARHTWRWITRG